jgi:hypothetical protein
LIAKTQAAGIVDRHNGSTCITPEVLLGRIACVELNPEKEGLSAQPYDFVQSYSNWPYHKVYAALG